MSDPMLRAEDYGPLTGVRIIEWGTNFSVPLGTMALADQGAEVIKVEAPAGDTTRYSTAHREGVKGLSASFVVANRNKRSIVLDMKHPEAIAAFRDLVKTADVFVQNFRPGVVERYRLGYDDLKEIKPDLIMVSVSGFGTKGPYSKQRVWDPIVQAVSGMMTAQADTETGTPCQMRSAVADKVTAYVVSQAITAALFRHAKTGEGQHVEIDMLSAALAFSWTTAMLNEMWLGDGVKFGANLKELRQVFRTKDGAYVCAIGISNPEWAALATAVGRPELIEDARFRETFDRLQRSRTIAEELSPVFLTKTAVEWMQVLRAHDVTCAPVNTPDNLHLDPQVVAAGLIEEVEHPRAGRYRQTVSPANFRGTPSRNRRHPPALGEHTEEVLLEAGLSLEQVAELKAEGGAI